MKEEAEMFAGEDEQRKILAELQNRADSLFYSYESTLRDGGSSVSEELRVQAETEAAALRGVIADKNAQPADINHLLEALQQSIFNIGAGLYRQVNEDDSQADRTNDMPGAPRVEPDSVEMPGAHLSAQSVEPVTPVVPVESDAQTVVADVSAATARGRTSSSVQVSSEVSPETPASSVSAPAASAPYAVSDDEYDVDSTLAANYEAIE